jgi:hypothetical protein
MRPNESLKKKRKIRRNSIFFFFLIYCFLFSLYFILILKPFDTWIGVTYSLDTRSSWLLEDFICRKSNFLKMCRQNEKKNRKQTPIKFLILDFLFFIAASLIRISQNRLAVYWTSGGAWVDRSRSCYKPINPPRSRAHPHYANFPFSKSNGIKKET